MRVQNNILTADIQEIEHFLTGYFARQNAAINDATHRIGYPEEQFYALAGVQQDERRDGYLIEFLYEDRLYQAFLPVSVKMPQADYPQMSLWKQWLTEREIPRVVAAKR